MYETELYHHGIKGQRWGIRRFQNKDGSLTRLGQKRADKQAKAAAKELEKRAARGQYSLDTKFESISGGKSIKPKRRSGLGAAAALAGAVGGAATLGKALHDAPKYTEKKGKKEYTIGKAKPILDSSKSVVDALASRSKNSAEAYGKKKAGQIDLSNASDKELQEYVNRYRLEKQFREITAEQYNSGRNKTMEMLETIGTVAGVAASVAGAVAAYKQLKG